MTGSQEVADGLVIAGPRQDDDFHAYEIRVHYRIEGGDEFTNELDAFADLDAWELSNDLAESRRMIEDVKATVSAGFESWCAHYHSLGLIRADFANYSPSPDLGDGLCCPRFYLICACSDAGLSPETLASFTPDDFELSSSSDGRKVTIYAEALLANATTLHSASARGAVGVGQWGGDATPELAPTPLESREDWLARVSISRERLARLVMRWSASGHQPRVFRAYGDNSERDTGNRPTEWLVDGVLARGVITLLAGDSTAGKTSLVHEWFAALGGFDGARQRTVLGQEVTGRFECAFVTGEGDAGMDFKRSTAHARAWGSATYAKFNGATRPLPEVFLDLREIPVLDLLEVDPMRAFRTGDEKSSDTVNEFYKPLEKFCEDMNCAVVVTQHFTKSGQKGRALDDMKSIVRGSGTVVERPRMVIVMDKLRDGTVRIAPAKHNLAEDELWCRPSQWSLWRRDVDTHTLVTLNGNASSSTDTGGIQTLVL